MQDNDIDPHIELLRLGCAFLSGCLARSDGVFSRVNEISKKVVAIAQRKCQALFQFLSYPSGMLSNCRRDAVQLLSMQKYSPAKIAAGKDNGS